MAKRAKRSKSGRRAATVGRGTPARKAGAKRARAAKTARGGKRPARPKRAAAGDGQASPADQRIAKSRGLLPEQVNRLREIRSLTDAAFAKIPKGKLRRAVMRLDYYDLPRAREAFRLLSQKDDEGRVPPTGLGDALRQLATTRSRGRARGTVAGLPTGARVQPRRLIAPPPTAGLSPAGTGWTALGPGNVGGRTRAIVVHPGTTDVIWAASAGGGVWRTGDAGVSWQPVDDFMANLATCCLVMDPTDPEHHLRRYR